MKKYALCARARSGKDTLADYLIKNKIVSKKYAFSTPIKKMINTLFKWDERHSDGELKEIDVPVNVGVYDVYKFIKIYNEYGFHEKYIHVNVFQVLYLFMQLLNLRYNNLKYNTFTGLYFGVVSPRKAYQIFGTEVGRDFIDPMIWLDLAPIEDVVIVDVRFPNEYEFIKKNNFDIISIKAKTKKINKHLSENYLDDFECPTVIHNDYTENFFKSIDELIINKVDK